MFARRLQIARIYIPQLQLQKKGVQEDECLFNTLAIRSADVK
jgi:hypothetical protein